MSNMISRSALVAAALTLGCVGAHADGNSVSTSGGNNLQVTATVTAACTIDGTTPVNFGTLSGPSVAQKDTSGSVSVTCPTGTDYNVGLGAGSGTGATPSTRSMTSGNNSLNYSLSAASDYSANWGNTAPTDTVLGHGNGASQPITVYGRVPTQSGVAAGSYTDDVVVTVSY